MYKFIIFIFSLVINLNAYEIRHFLMPQDGKYAENSIINDIYNAKKNIKIAMFMVTNKRLVKSLIDKYNKSKIDITLIADKSYNKNNLKKSKLNMLSSKNAIKVYITQGLKKKKNKYGILHAKLVIIDDNIVYLGSTNWTKSAYKYNYEIMIRIDDYTTAKLYTLYFNDILKSAKRLFGDQNE